MVASGRFWRKAESHPIRFARVVLTLVRCGTLQRFIHGWNLDRRRFPLLSILLSRSECAPSAFTISFVDHIYTSDISVDTVTLFRIYILDGSVGCAPNGYSR
jgi:hypothetical protein